MGRSNAHSRSNSLVLVQPSAWAANLVAAVMPHQHQLYQQEVTTFRSNHKGRKERGCTSASLYPFPTTVRRAR
jgi:hypothetical protein